jgi:hypothetical protein
MSDKKPRPHDMEVYVSLGLQLIPLHKWDAVDAKGRARGKTPRDGAWQAKDYDSRQVLEAVRRTSINGGVRLPAGIMVLDVDPRNFGEGHDRLAELVLTARLDLSTAPHTITGSGGSHYWFRKPADVTLLDSLHDFPGIEFKSYGRQVVAAGSVHPCGAHYEWDDFAPHLSEMPELPDSLLRLIRRPVRAHGEAAGLGDLTPEMLAETLEQLDAEDFQEHEEWLNLMMACHHATAGEGRQEFIDWSTQDGKYVDDGWIIGRRWDSLHTATSARPVTIKYLHKVVQDHGGEVARVAAEDDFEEYELPEAEGAGVDDKALREEPKAEGKAGVLDEMNEKHCVVMEGGKFRIFTEQRDPVLDRVFYQRSSKEDFENLYCNQLMEVGDKLVTKSSVWLRSASRRQYNGVIFDPERDHDGWLNLWKGWSVEPIKGDWSLLQQLLLEVLVDGDEGHRDYVMNWMAYMVQHPARAAEVALCFRGDKGTGKGTLGRALSDLAGANGLNISSPEHLVGRFNSHLQNCIFLFADEAFWAGDKSGEAKLKQLVTEPTIAYEGKGRDATTGKNLIHIMMAANGDWVVPAGLDGERRFGVFEVSNAMRGNTAFFNALNKQMYREGGLSAMLHDLLTRDIGEWTPRNSVPATKALMKQKIMSMDDVERWWYGCLMDGMLPGAGDWDQGRVVVIKETLRADYLEFAKEQRTYRPADQVAFGMRLAKLVSATNTQTKPPDDAYGLKVDRNGRASAYALPSLAECRQSFEKKMGAALEWLPAMMG